MPVTKIIRPDNTGGIDNYSVQAMFRAFQYAQRCLCFCLRVGSVYGGRVGTKSLGHDPLPLQSGNCMDGTGIYQAFYVEFPAFIYQIHGAGHVNVIYPLVMMRGDRDNARRMNHFQNAMPVGLEKGVQGWRVQ